MRVALQGALFALALGCAERDGPPVAISAVRAFVPLPGSRLAAVYFTIDNGTSQNVVITGFESPDFAQVELHETRIADGVARMRPLPQLIVPARSSVTLAEGGLHLMLMEPRVDFEAGQKVTIALRDATGETHAFDARLRSRTL